MRRTRSGPGQRQFGSNQAPCVQAEDVDCALAPGAESQSVQRIGHCARVVRHGRHIGRAVRIAVARRIEGQRLPIAAHFPEQHVVLVCRLVVLVKERQGRPVAPSGVRPGTVVVNLTEAAVHVAALIVRHGRLPNSGKHQPHEGRSRFPAHHEEKAPAGETAGAFPNDARSRIRLSDRRCASRRG